MQNIYIKNNRNITKTVYILITCNNSNVAILVLITNIILDWCPFCLTASKFRNETFLCFFLSNFIWISYLLCFLCKDIFLCKYKTNMCVKSAYRDCKPFFVYKKDKVYWKSYNISSQTKIQTAPKSLNFSPSKTMPFCFVFTLFAISCLFY